jgi:hypothetical protein
MMKDSPEGIELMVVPVDRLVDDPDVQLVETFNLRKARDIGANFHHKKVGVLRGVLGPGDTIYVWDGRHRLYGAKLAGIKELRVDVYKEDLSISDKCVLKLAHDKDRRQVLRLENFLIRVKNENEAKARDISALVAEAGYRIGKKDKSEKVFSCPAALENLYDELGSAGFRRMLALNTMWRGEPKTTHPAWLLALGLIVRDGYADALVAKVAKVSEVIPAKVLRTAQGKCLDKQQSPQPGASQWRLIHQFMADGIRKGAGIRKDAASV